VDATVDLDHHNELVNSPTDGTELMVGKVSGTLAFSGGTSSLLCLTSLFSAL